MKMRVDRKDGEIVFKIDSKIAYYGKTQVNLDTAPTILENFTVVPLRALGDALGAETQYEDATRTVTVKYQDKEIVFYIDSKLVKVNNEWESNRYCCYSYQQSCDDSGSICQ